MTSIKIWILGARPKTLFAAIAPIITASFYVIPRENFSFLLTLLALIVAISLQVGVNYANDYSDGIRGTDAGRIGPVRLVGQDLASPNQVKSAALISFLIGALAGLAISYLVNNYWLLLIGFSAIVSAWFYTGGKNPYGYRGFGEIFVFIYFGLVATMGTVFIQTGFIDIESFILGSIMGSFAVAILLSNNLRDLTKDAKANKRTLAVKLGDRYTRFLLLFFILKPFFNLGFIVYFYESNAALAFLTLFFLIQPIKTITLGASGKDLIPVLVKIGQAQFLFAIFLLISLIF